MSRPFSLKSVAWVTLAASPYAFALLGQTAKPAAQVTFTRDVAPIFKAHCLSCHTGAKSAGGLDLSNEAGIKKGGVSGALWVSGKADASVLIQRVLGQGGKPKMPMGFAPLSTKDLATLKAWVNQGGKFAAPAASASFAKDVMPVFKAHCVSCHNGPQGAGGLDLSSEKGVQKGGVSGPMVVAGNPAKSILIQRILGQGGKPKMPMGFAPLPAKTVDAIKSWIAAGASYADAGDAIHWAYKAPVRPPVPVVKNTAWVRTPIDNFVLARLEKEGLKPSQRATRETLIRRLSLDLTGLPPTLAEIDAFAKDTSPNAYEKVVDRLLASPHFGERQAQSWLDLARYADTNGYEKDQTRVAWKYRDWVIDAFNHNMPYDRFTVEQLAGDLLPNPTLADLVATGFHRNTMLNLEGGVDQEEARYEVINDRVATTSTVWLGQTLQCARCHDHKYDPWSQKDYFKMYAIFSNTDFTPIGDASVSEQKYIEPSIEAPTPEQALQREALRKVIGGLDEDLKKSTPELDKAKAELVNALRTRTPWNAASVSKADAGMVTLTAQSDGTFTATGANPNQVHYAFDLQPGETTISAIRVDTFPVASLANKGSGRSQDGNFVLSKVEASLDGKPVAFAGASADFVQQGFNLNDLFDDKGDTGWAVHPQIAQPHSLMLYLKEPVKMKAGQTFRLTLCHDSTEWVRYSIGHLRVSVSPEVDRGLLAASPEILALAKTDYRTPEQEAKLDSYFRANTPLLAEDRTKRSKSQAELDMLQRQIPMALVMREKPSKGPIMAPVHPRGEFLQKGEMVMAGIPSLFVKEAKPAGMTRLSLAKWLVDPKNPLTARVQVNRMWEQYFGHGIVETSDNFGTQGSLPSHPELLDWLATEFMRQKWDMKAIHKMIVMSSTYRQASEATSVLLEKDPSNTLYARGPRFRLDAETIRDNALAAAGMLNDQIGGPSVYPYQPQGIWNSPYNGEYWRDSQGAERYRRGLYTFLKRTAPYPMYTNFDASSREVCTVRRIRTNTPLQALNLLNDQSFLEAAKGLAERTVKAKSDAKSRIIYAFRLTTCRAPSSEELARLQALLTKLKSRYQADPESAKKLGGTPEQAAWTMVANVLLNLDETITKE